ncbi:MAG: hypothetical protein K2N74_01840, partial [Clostridiales bacterium]|nr:hypothetical protein [Clostridiales bacterium]
AYTMSVMFGNWKYIFKNFWYILPFAILPALFLTLSLDYGAISDLLHMLFSGHPRGDFVMLFRAFSLIRVDSVLGVIYSAVAVITVVLFTALMIALAEKHMRIGKRTLGGISTQFGNLILPVLCVTMLYLILFEVWAVVLSAVMFAISHISSAGVVYLLYALAFAAITVILFYLCAMFYLWIPGIQITCFKPYHAFVYSYRLMTGVRGKIVLSFIISFVIFCIVIGGSVFLPEYAFLPIGFLMFVFMYPGFCIRMETVYFYTDKIDREDLIRSYREL